MKLIAIILIFIISYTIFPIDVPDWVPDNKKVAFIKMVETSNKLKEITEEYRKVLSSVPVITICKIQDDESIYIEVKRHTMTEKLIIYYTLKPNICKLNNGIPEISFSTKIANTFWEDTKNILIIVGTLGLGIFIGYFIK
jgi:hypothetical protein